MGGNGEAPLLNVRSAAQNELVTSQDFITWMRAAILPRVRKLYRVIPGGLAAGTYTLEIRSNYDPLIFDSGTHRVLIHKAFLHAATALRLFIIQARRRSSWLRCTAR